MNHVVYCDDKEKVLDKIMSGSKKSVIRGAKARKIPHSRVFEGEILYFMEKGSAKISAKATVTHVENHTKLSDDESFEILEQNQNTLNLSKKQKMRWHKSSLCIVTFTDVIEIAPAFSFEKQGNMDDWLIVEKVEDVLVGSSIPFNYENAKFK